MSSFSCLGLDRDLGLDMLGHGQSEWTGAIWIRPVQVQSDPGWVKTSRMDQ